MDKVEYFVFTLEGELGFRQRNSKTSDERVTGNLDIGPKTRVQCFQFEIIGVVTRRSEVVDTFQELDEPDEFCCFVFNFSLLERVKQLTVELLDDGRRTGNHEEMTDVVVGEGVHYSMHLRLLLLA